MKRSLVIGFVCALSLTGFLACGKPPVACDPDTLMTKPQLCPDRESLGFAQEFGSGTFIGTSVPETLGIKNGGVQDLAISSVTFTGDSAFTMSTEPAMIPATIKGGKNFFVRILFAPTAAKIYTGKLKIESNAENTPTREFAVSGCGVPADGGVSPCYRDGGTSP